MNKEKLQQLMHVIAGVLIIVHGFARFEMGDFLFAAAYLSIAITFVLFAGFHKKIVQRLMQGDVAIFLLEALILFSAAYHYHSEGKSFLYYALCLVAGFYFVIACMSFQKDTNPRRSSRRRRRKKKSSGLEKEFLKAGQVRNNGSSAGNV